MSTSQSLILQCVAVMLLLCPAYMCNKNDQDFEWDDLDMSEPPLEEKPCELVVSAYQSIPPVSKPPVREIPSELLAEYTLNGTVATAEFFVDDTIGGRGSHYKYRKEDVDGMIEAAKKYVNGRSKQRLPPMDLNLFTALEQHSIVDADIVVFGSMQPWSVKLQSIHEQLNEPLRMLHFFIKQIIVILPCRYESIGVAFGANSVHTVEYNKLTYDHPKLTQSTPGNLTIPIGGFDAAFSISSFDHDGLGRYGDPIVPNGDLEAMRTAKCLLRPGGLLFLTVPVGPDVVVWNLHRRYGKVRLPHLLAGFEVVQTFGYSRRKLTAEADFRRSFEPVFVLRRPLNIESCTAAE